MRSMVLFVLASAFLYVEASDCSIVLDLWKSFGRVVPLDPNNNKADACCEMIGIECIKDSVIRINWNGQSLVGNITSKIGDLRSLNSLILSNNSIDGIIPDTIGNLEKLENLELNSNIIYGNIPSTIGQLKKLQKLSLSDNQLFGSVPRTISNCQDLRSLSLQNNKLTGNIPPDLEILDKLRSLNLSSNQFSNTVSACLINGMSSLISLDMSNNPNLTGAIWPASKNLTFLTLRTNLTDCTNGESSNAACKEMKCIRPADGNAVAWWIVGLLGGVWFIIFGVLGYWLYIEYLKRKLASGDHEDGKSMVSGDDGDTDSVVTKLDGLMQERRSYNSDFETKSTAFTNFFKQGALKDKHESESYADNRPMVVVQPHTPANDDELEIAVGDLVELVERFDDGWAFGKSKITDKSGVFPLVCVEQE